MAIVDALGLRARYRRLPPAVRRWRRPLDVVDALAARLPPPRREPIVRATDAARRIAHLRRVRYALRRLEGATADGTPLACVIAADDRSTRFWRQTLFAAVREERVMATIGPLQALRPLAAAQDADVVVQQAPWPLAPLAHDAHRVPSWVPLSLATDRSFAEIVAGDRSGRAARKNDVRRVERSGLAPRIAHDRATVERFHAEVYEPYVRGRFGVLAFALPLAAFRHACRHGELLLLEDGRGVRGGTLLEPHGDALRVLAFGAVDDGPEGRVAIEACYCHAIRRAVERGFRRLALGTARPVLTDGVLRYKRKWGARLERPTTRDRFLLRHRDTAGARAAFTAAPVVIDAGGGRLAALVGVEGVDAAARLAGVDVPGLVELRVLGVRTPPPAPYARVRGLAGAT